MMEIVNVDGDTAVPAAMGRLPPGKGVE